MSARGDYGAIPSESWHEKAFQAAAAYQGEQHNMRYSWHWCTVAGETSLILKDADDTLVALVTPGKHFATAYLVTPLNGPAAFAEFPRTKFSMLGVFPSATAGTKAVKREVELCKKFGRFPNIVQS